MLLKNRGGVLNRFGGERSAQFSGLPGNRAHGRGGVKRRRVIVAGRAVPYTDKTVGKDGSKPMTPRLTALSGPLKGSVFPLTPGEISIGRHTSNQICVGDLRVSRRHCLLRCNRDRFTLVDLESRNGSFVNGVPVKERELEEGDRIEIGDSVFLFLCQEPEDRPAPTPVRLEEGGLPSTTTVRLRREDAVYALATEAGTAARSARKARDLDALLRISLSINSIRELEPLQHRLLDLIFEVIPAQRGAILLTGSGAEDFVSVFGRERSSASSRPLHVSRTVIRQVLQERAGILSNDVLQGQDFSPAQSLVASQVSSLLAAPLMLFERVIGAIYLDTSNPAVRFDEDHLQLLTGIAGIAAIALDNARQIERLESENERLQSEIQIEHNLVGESAAMREVLQFIAKVAPHDSTVLICGESGTGKELVARALHANSPRAPKPFVAINCAALPDSLLESELFGHERGAFTGAVSQKKGKLEVANEGTVFLDEIGELAPLLQAKMLRVLQEREFERVGGTHPLKLDVRLIAATNRNLEEAIRNGTFRQDLYFRLNVVSITIPPLRERRGDIPLLATHFAAKHSRLCKRRPMGLSPEARECLMRYDWPGNVRELENVIERAVVMSSGGVIRPEDLPEEVVESARATGAPSTRYHEAIQQEKKRLILQAFGQAAGNYTEAAKLLGVHPNYLHRLIRNLNLKGELRRPAAGR